MTERCDAILDRPDAEQHHLRRVAVSIVGRLLARLRADAHSQPRAWRLLHARRLSRRHDLALWRQLLARGARGRTGRRPAGHPVRALHPAAARRQCAGPGSGDTRRLFHHRRPVPADLDRRPVDAACARGVAAAAPICRPGLPDVPSRRAGDCAGDGGRPLRPDGPHAAWRNDPRRRRRHGDGARRRHPGVAVVHRRILPWRRSRGRRRHPRRADAQRLSRARCRHAAARADRGDPRRRRLTAWRFRRQLRRRLPL